MYKQTYEEDNVMGQCYNVVEISSPVDEVWKTICDFHDMSWASGVITSLEKVGEKNGDEVGAKRVLNDAFHETLTEYNPSSYTFSYSIDDGPGPVASGAVRNYVGVVKLRENNGVCLVEWSSAFESTNEDDVIEFCNPIYQALLNAMKETLLLNT